VNSTATACGGIVTEGGAGLTVTTAAALVTEPALLETTTV